MMEDVDRYRLPSSLPSNEGTIPTVYRLIRLVMDTTKSLKVLRESGWAFLLLTGVIRGKDPVPMGRISQVASRVMPIRADS
jgi:hypothetical protein